jgi:hypothetical protein
MKIQILTLFSRPMPGCFMITQDLSSFSTSEDFVSLYQTKRRDGKGEQSKFSVTET